MIKKGNELSNLNLKRKNMAINVKGKFKIMVLIYERKPVKKIWPLFFQEPKINGHELKRKWL